MGRSLTNNTAFAYAIEESLETLPLEPSWKTLEPNTINTFGAEITTVARNPISKERQRRKGTTTDLGSSVEFEGDLTLEHWQDFVEGFAFATSNGPVILQSGDRHQDLAADNDPPPAGTDSGYTHDALGSALPANTLLYASGFSNVTNNGFKVVIAGSTTTATLISTALVDEVPSNAANAKVAVCGRRGATADLTITVTGDTAVLGSTLLDFTTLSLTVGQLIHVGGLTGANQFSAGAGYARITSIAATAIGLDKLDSTLATDTGAGETVDLLFGKFIRNVAVDDADYLERSFQFEAAYKDLQVPGPGDEYEYALGNYCNQISLNLPLADKATLTFGFVGTDTEPPSTTRKDNADAPERPVATSAFNTSADIVRLRIMQTDFDEIGTAFKSLTLTLDNQVTPEKILGRLGAAFLNTGNFLVGFEAQLLFTDSRVAAAVRDNETLTMDFVLENDNGAIAVDIPSLTLGGGGKDYPVNESILINTTGEAFKDVTLGTSIGVSLFPVIPI